MLPFKMSVITRALFLFCFQDDEKFLTELFAQLTDEATDDDKRHELVMKAMVQMNT